MKRDKYMGLDVHQATTVVAVQDAEGKLVFETIVETEGGRITRLLEGLSGPMHVALEETTQAELLSREDRQFPTSWCSDGEVLGFYEWTQASWDIGVLDGDPPTIVFNEGAYHEVTPTFSPDCGWLVYVSDQSGRDEVYARPYPGSGGRIVSSDGGDQPVWSPDGRELYYRNGDLFMRVPVETTQTEFPFGTPEVLFEGRYAQAVGGVYYDVHPDGDRFLMLQPSQDATPSELRVVLNWFEELKERVPVR